MNNTKTTKRALLSSVIAMLLCVAMLIGTTFAWFTDSVTSGVNKIQAGNLDVEVDYSVNGASWDKLDGSDSLFSQNLWEPGHTEVVYLRVKNAGTLAFNYKVLVTPVSENGGVNVNGESFKLSDYLVFGTTAPSNTPTTYTRDTARAAVGSTTGLSDVNTLTRTGTMAGSSNAYQYMALVVYMPESVGNEANYKTGTAAPTIELGIKVVATQKTAESDSFDNQYDADAVNTPFYTVGAYYNYFEAVNVTATADGDGNFTVTKTDENTGIIASASGTATAGTEVNLLVQKSSEAEKNFTITVEDGHELNGYDIKVTGQTAGSLVQGKLYVGTGLENFKFYHNNAPMSVGTQGSLTNGQYYYNSTDGYVYFASTTFSPFQATYKAPVAAIGTAVYGTLADAFAAVKSGETITLLKNSAGNGIKVPSGSNFTVDFRGYTYNIDGTTVGSAGTETNGFQLLKDSSITFKDGSLTSNKAKLLIQNYANLTLDNMTIDVAESSVCNYAVSNNNGNVVIKDTTITAYEGKVAFDVYSFASYTGANVTVTDNSVINGKIEVASGSGANTSDLALRIESGTINGEITVADALKEKVTITGGVFAYNPDSEYLATGYKATLEGEYYVVSLCTDHVYEDGVCKECGKVQETWLAIENAMTAAPEGYSVDGTNVTISTNYGLAWFAKQVNAGNNFANYTVTLTNDIDLLDYAWTPINGFTGTFDGGEYTISNIYVNGSPTGNGYGLFGASNAKAYKNVNIHNVYVVGNSALGTLVGKMFTGTVDNVHVSGNIMIGINTENGHIANFNSSYAGGIVGHGYAKISNCSVKGNDGSVIGHGRQVGGIYGFSGEGNFTPVKNCSVENVTIVGTHSVGGILGWAHYGNNVENCSIKNVAVKITKTNNSIGFITGTTNAEDCGNNQMMEFYGNTVNNSSLYVQDVFVSNESTMENMYAPYGYGPCYTTDGNGNYVFFANKTEADKYVVKHPDMTIKYTSFNGQIAGAEDGAVISIDQDMTVTRIELLANKTVTIDLKGHTITDTGADVFLVKSGKLIVIDSVGGGKIIHTGTDDLVWLQDGGTLQLDAGSYSFATKYGITYGTGSLIINGGSYEFDSNYQEGLQEYVSTGKTVTINGESFTQE